MTTTAWRSLRRLGVPGRSIHNGVVKGWAAARAAHVLRADGVKNFCLNAGGDVIVAGSPGANAAWHIGLRAPRDPEAIFTVLAVSDCAVATSGTSERGEHIIDGRSGRPARELTCISVIADDLTIADVLATAAFALGTDGVAWAARHGARSVLALTADGTLLTEGPVPLARA